MVCLATHEEVSTRIEHALREQFADRRRAATAYGAEFVELWDAAAQHALGGKLLRPRLLLDVHEGFTAGSTGAAFGDSAVRVAASIELLHFAFLLHDDVIDEDLLRRRKPNLIGALAQSPSLTADTAGLHWARSSAILMGDLLLSTAILNVARVDVDEPTRSRLLSLVDHTIFETVAGEHADVALSDGLVAPNLETILKMSSYKTATYSFGLPLRAAAILAGVSVGAENAMSIIGSHLGLAYQLQDDLLSVFGDSLLHGKDPFSDLREGKETAVIAYARLTSSWGVISPRFGDAEVSDNEALAMRDALRECGAERFVQSLVEEQFAAGFAALDRAHRDGELPLPVMEAVFAVAKQLESRTS